MILSGQTIRKLCTLPRPGEVDHPLMIQPFAERGVANGKSYGLSVAGYDIRLSRNVTLLPGEMELAAAIERFDMPLDVMGMVKDKSSWARTGLSVYNTVIEPGWKGFLTLELVYHGTGRLMLVAGDPIAQVVFQRLDEPAEKGYAGKYQHQGPEPTPARYEGV